jgi:hypothetical protein
MPAMRRALIVALFLIALGATMLHIRIHPIYVPENHDTAAAQGAPVKVHFSGEHFAAIAIGVIDAVLVTALFCSIRTAPLAYLLNGMFVIFGTVFMAHFGIADVLKKFGSPTLWQWIFQTTLADIVILWVDFFIGKAIYDSYGISAP